MDDYFIVNLEDYIMSVIDMFKAEARLDVHINYYFSSSVENYIFSKHKLILN